MNLHQLEDSLKSMPVEPLTARWIEGTSKTELRCGRESIAVTNRIIDAHYLKCAYNLLPEMIALVREIEDIADCWRKTSKVKLALDAFKMKLEQQ